MRKIDFEKFVCREDFAIIERHIASDQTSSGLYVTAGSAGNDLTATVKAVGPGRRTQTGELIEHDVRVGDVVLLDPLSGVKLETDEGMFYVVRLTEIYGCIR